MEQYINKAAVLLEIENLLDKGRYLEVYDCAYRDGNNSALCALKGKLDTFVKAAKHFYKLRLKATQKGE